MFGEFGVELSQHIRFDFWAFAVVIKVVKLVVFKKHTLVLPELELLNLVPLAAHLLLCLLRLLLVLLDGVLILEVLVVAAVVVGVVVILLVDESL